MGVLGGLSFGAAGLLLLTGTATAVPSRPRPCALISTAAASGVLKQQVHLRPSGHAECILRTPHRFYADIFLDIAPATAAAFNAARVGTIRTFPVPGGVGYVATHSNGDGQQYEDAVVRRRGYVADLETNTTDAAYDPGSKLATLAQLRSLALLVARAL